MGNEHPSDRGAMRVRRSAWARAGQSRPPEVGRWPSFRHDPALQKKHAADEKGLKMGSKHRPMGDEISRRTT